ncbi:MAG: radical SAM family heme chaperone HemW [Clostridia bacterium]|nr:radical SAM family heme chaperone HemW [Clostridia bacterium]
MLGLYIHIPFCVKKCNYCDFYSLCRPQGGNLSEYVSILCTQIEREAHLYGDYTFDTIFIGGGTPSLLEVQDIELLCSTIMRRLNIAQGAEFSIEANPGTLSREKLLAWKNGGVNRLSLGLQSTSDTELCALGRIHTLKDFEKSYSLARECGFDNISVDIMYALPEQSRHSLTKTLDYVIKLAPEHISAYCLKIEDSTPFGKRLAELTLPDEDTQYNMYLDICSRLSMAGYEQYEISNFSRAGYRSRHNMKYWLSEDYVGFGPSSHSFFEGRRYYYERDIDAYLDSIRSGDVPSRTSEAERAPSLEEQMDEYVMLKLRLCDGVDVAQFKNRFGVDFSSRYELEKYIKSGHVIKNDSSYSFTPSGFFVSNFILSDILKSI